MKNTAKQLCACLVMAICSCNIDDLEFDKIKSPTYNPSLSIKLGSANYTIKELVDDIEDEKLEVNEGTDFFLTFIYRDTTTFNTESDFIEISTIQNTTTVAGGNNIPPSPVDFTIPVSQAFTFTYDANDGELLDSAFYSSGTLNVDISSDFEGSFDFTWSIIDTKDVETNIDLSNNAVGVYNGSTPVVSQFSRPLLGLKSLITVNGSQNEFQLQLDGNIQIPAGTTVSPEQQITIDVTFANPEFSSVFGDFGTKTVDLANQTIDMEGFEEFGENGLELNDPKIIIELDNYYGVGLNSSLNGVKSVNNDGTEINLTGVGGTLLTDELVEGVSNTNVGGFQTSIIELNKSNSNIDVLLNSTPTSMVFPITAQMNPTTSSLLTNFYTDSGFVEQRTIVEIPLDVKMNGFSREFDFDISDIDIEDATDLTIRVITINKMPLSGSVDLQFLDEGGSVIHEILNESVFNSPEVGTDGRTGTPNESIEDIELDQTGIDAFIEATKINAIISVNSFDATNGTFVKIFSDYSLDIRFSVTGTVSIQL